MAFKFNPLTGEFDLVNKASNGGSNTFDPTPTMDLIATTNQGAIEEVDQSFSPHRIPTGKKITVRINRTLVTSSMTLFHNSQLVIIGRVIIL